MVALHAGGRRRGDRSGGNPCRLFDPLAVFRGGRSHVAICHFAQLD